MVCFYMAFLPSEGIPPWCHPERSDDDPSKSMIWVTDHMHEMQGSVLQYDPGMLVLQAAGLPVPVAFSALLVLKIY